MTLPQREAYSVGYGSRAHRWHMRRTAAERASFFLPFLRPGLVVLDCGCGPGSITIGIAELVAPGQVVGVDVEPRQIERAQQLAADRKRANARFAVADVCRLPFPTASFDAAFAHNVMEHLADPLAALKEIRRVLRPGGVVGVRDPDFGTTVLSPLTPLMDRAGELLLRVRELSGTRPDYARHQRYLLLQAGFVRCEGFAFAECQGTIEDTRAFADVLIEVLQRPETMEVAIRQGWVDRSTMAAMIAEIHKWSERPDAFRALLDCAALGWASE